jgi:hypothetical protein
MFLSTCNSNTQTNNTSFQNTKKYNTLDFNVDPNFLSDFVVYNNSRFGFSVPRDFELLPKDDFLNVKRKFEEIITGDSTIVNSKLLDIFLDNNSMSACLVSEILTPDYEKIKSYLTREDNKSYEFYHKGLWIFQVLTIKNDIVNFKLICSPSLGQTSLTMVDYIVPLKVYDNIMIKQIESSIGSITKM